MNVRRLQRDLYLASRLAGDYQAAKRGPQPLARRLVKRVYHRKLLGLLRRVGAW